ncbi:DNA sulfur modification protein DndB [Imperialibacter roseus]|uniref:DNA sulfur modification protein DndB n=1 Tax=Imperialibacter roseus TaxID=1324217 RepID=A0ABZ0ILJ9_9BACT|nr:DNA sulfur modification protein DndB [Imperialibacter roseus]WOK05069.1 DNA sulfur modification protein DndB [Imperialibacter roseus]
MKIPAIRSKIGDRVFYTTSLTFKQVSDHVEKIDDQLHKSKTLSDLIQRSITNNYLSIRDYILNQPQLFFNSLVLAVYNNYPDWTEVKLEYDEHEIYTVGLLEFPADGKIFPVDGQHRVEGIKAALLTNPELESQQIGAIIIGHESTDEGKEKTRRLFTTLNRYAKPVTLNDVIALDEDDTVAIVTRHQIEEYPLFQDKRVVISKQKAIPERNRTAITSIINLYQCNIEIFKQFYFETFNEKATKKRLENYLKFRRNGEEIEAFREYCLGFWNCFCSGFNIVTGYLRIPIEDNPVGVLRNNDTGGNLLFRPVGLLPFVQAVIEIHKRENSTYEDIFRSFNGVDFQLNAIPWKSVLWDDTNGKMIMGSSTVTKLLFLRIYSEEIMTEIEVRKLREDYASRLNLDEEEVDQELERIPTLT